MVHATDTALTDATMVCSRGSRIQEEIVIGHSGISTISPVGLTPDTDCPILPLKVVLPVIGVNVGKVQSVLRQWHCTRITQHRPDVRHGQKEHKRVEEQDVNRGEDTGRQKWWLIGDSWY